MTTQNGTYPWSSAAKIFCNGLPSQEGDRKTFKWWLQLKHLESLVY